MGPGCRAYRFGVRRLGFRVMCASCLRSHISGLSFRDMAPLCFHLHERYSHCRRSLLTSCDVGCFTRSNDTRKHNLRHVDTRKHSLRYIDRCTQWPELPCAESAVVQPRDGRFWSNGTAKIIAHLLCHEMVASICASPVLCSRLLSWIPGLWGVISEIPAPDIGLCPGYQDSGELFLKSLLQILSRACNGH